MRRHTQMAFCTFTCSVSQKPGKDCQGGKISCLITPLCLRTPARKPAVGWTLQIGNRPINPAHQKRGSAPCSGIPKAPCLHFCGEDMGLDVSLCPAGCMCASPAGSSVISRGLFYGYPADDGFPTELSGSQSILVSYTPVDHLLCGTAAHGAGVGQVLLRKGNAA